MPYFYDNICQDAIKGEEVIVVAHGNSLRAIVKNLSNKTPKEIIAYNIPTAEPFVYEFDYRMTPQKMYYLISEEELKRREQEVAQQTKKH